MMTEDDGNMVLALTASMFVLATFFVLIRIASRVIVVKRPGWDDFLIVVSWLISAAMSIGLCWAAKHGAGINDGTVDPAWQRGLIANFYVFSVLYPIVTTTTRAAILLLYIRLSTAYPWLGKASYCIMAVSVLTGAITSGIAFFQCHSLGSTFRTWLSGSNTSDASCIDIITMHMCVAPIQFLLNVAVVLLPLPIITEIRMERRQKYVLLSTLALGSSVCIVTICRIVFLQGGSLASQSERAGLAVSRGKGLQYYENISWVLSLLEVNIGIICACILVLKPLVMRIMPGFFFDSRIPRTTGSDVESKPWSWSRHPAQTDDSTKDGKSDEDEAMNESSKRDAMPELGLADILQMDRRPSQKLSWIAIPLKDSSSDKGFKGFVTMRASIPLPCLRGSEEYRQMLALTAVLLLCDFAYGLVAMLNTLVNNAVGLTASQSIAMFSVFWMSALVGCPLLGYGVLMRPPGLKGGLVVGLWFSAAATLGYWPASVLASLAGCMISTVLLSFGNMSINLAASAFIALCGSENLMESRMNLAQGIGTVGHLVALVVAREVLSDSVDQVEDLTQREWCFFCFGLFSICLSVAIFYMRLSEASAEELEERAKQRFQMRTLDRQQRTFGLRTLHVVILGALATQFALYGAQQVMDQFRDSVILSYAPSLSEARIAHLAYVDSAMTISGRIFAALACYRGAPGRVVLLISCTGCTVFACLASLAPGTVSPSASAACFLLYTLFQGPATPTLWALALRGTGRQAILISIMMSMGWCGGGFFPPITYVLGSHGQTAVASIRLVIGLCAVPTLIWAVASVTPSLRAWMDPSPEGSAPTKRMDEVDDNLIWPPSDEDTRVAANGQIKAPLLHEPIVVEADTLSDVDALGASGGWETMKLGEIDPEAIKEMSEARTVVMG